MSWPERLLAFFGDDRTFLCFAGLAAFGIVFTVTTNLTIIRDDNEVPPKEPKTQYITQETEDSLAIHTLDTLVSHHNYSIREVAIKILCDRALNDKTTFALLLDGITQRDHDGREKCLRALSLVIRTATGDGIWYLNNQTAYSAIVKSLEQSINDVEPPEVTCRHWDEYPLRDVNERFCLMFAHELVMKYGPDQLVQAGFVEKWLAKQAWGNTPEDRDDAIEAYVVLQTNIVREIISRIMASERGLAALKKAGLSIKNRSFGRMRLPIGGSRPSDESYLTSGPRNWPRWSVEEQRLRRQHREAMVFNDGTRPLGEGDIIERDD